MAAEELGLSPSDPQPANRSPQHWALSPQPHAFSLQSSAVRRSAHRLRAAGAAASALLLFAGCAALLAGAGPAELEARNIDSFAGREGKIDAKIEASAPKWVKEDYEHPIKDLSSVPHLSKQEIRTEEKAEKFQQWAKGWGQRKIGHQVLSTEPKGPNGKQRDALAAKESGSLTTSSAEKTREEQRAQAELSHIDSESSTWTSLYNSQASVTPKRDPEPRFVSTKATEKLADEQNKLKLYGSDSEAKGDTSKDLVHSMSGLLNQLKDFDRNSREKAAEHKSSEEVKTEQHMLLKLAHLQSTGGKGSKQLEHQLSQDLMKDAGSDELKGEEAKLKAHSRGLDPAAGAAHKLTIAAEARGRISNEKLAGEPFGKRLPTSSAVTARDGPNNQMLQEGGTESEIADNAEGSAPATVQQAPPPAPAVETKAEEEKELKIAEEEAERPWSGDNQAKLPVDTENGGEFSREAEDKRRDLVAGLIVHMDDQADKDGIEGQNDIKTIHRLQKAYPYNVRGISQKFAFCAKSPEELNLDQKKKCASHFVWLLLRRSMNQNLCTETPCNPTKHVKNPGFDTCLNPLLDRKQMLVCIMRITQIANE